MEGSMTYFPEVLVPIAIFFGLSVFVASSISVSGTKNIEKD